MTITISPGKKNIFFPSSLRLTKINFSDAVRRKKISGPVGADKNKFSVADRRRKPWQIPIRGARSGPWSAGPGRALETPDSGGRTLKSEDFGEIRPVGDFWDFSAGTQKKATFFEGPKKAEKWPKMRKNLGI